MGSPPSANLKKRIVIWTSVLIVFAAAFFGLARLGTFFSSEILFQLVKRETNGYYQLSFEEIDIDLWKRTIKLNKVVLKPDPEKDYQEKGLNNLYELEMAGLNIDLKSILSIYTIRQLHIKNIRIIDPQIHIMRKKNTPDESFSIQTGNLYKEISDYLRVLQIDVFTIDNASVKHFPSELGLNNIDFFIRNLLINSASRPDKQFYSENIELEIHNQSFKLKDSIHQISFDHFLLSTADSVLTFQNLVLRPVSNTPRALDSLNDETIYHISIPTLRLKGVDYFSAYRYNHLEMEELSLTDSYIFLNEQSKTISDNPAKPGNSIFEQLIDVFDEVRVGKMRFINANLDLKTNDDYNHNYQHVQSQRADIVLYDFILDSSNYQFGFNKKYFDNLDINIKDYRSYLPDSVHTIQFDLLKLSSIDSSVSFKNFNISNNGQGTSDLFLSIDVPQARLTGLNFSDMLLRKQLRIRDMFIQKPNIIFEHRQQIDQFDFTPDSLYRLIVEHFNLVGIENLNISQGEFSINNLLRSEETNLSVTNFNIPSESNTWYDVLGNIKLEMQSVVLDDHAIKLNANLLVLDPLSRSLVLDEFSLDYGDKQVVVSGDLSKLKISGIDLDHISAGNYHAFDSISMINPRVNVEVLQPGNKQLTDDFLSDIFIEVIDGELNAKTYDSITISLDNIYTNLILGSISHIQSGVAERFSITLPNTSNKLNISEINLSNPRNLFLKDISLQPINGTTTQKMNLSGSIPVLNIFGLDQNLFWEHGKLAGDSVMILSSDISVDLKKAGNTFSPVDSIELQFEKIILDKARLSYFDENQTELKTLRIPEFSGVMEGFHYPQKAMLSTDHLLYSDDVTMHLTQVQPVLRSGNTLTIQELDFSKNARRIAIKSLNYEASGGSVSARFPDIKMTGFDLDTYLNEQRLDLVSLDLVAPRIIYDRSIKSKDANQDDESMPKSIDIGSFSSISTEIEIKDQKSISYFIHDGNLLIRKFFAEGDLNWKQFFEYSQYASISGQNFAAPLDDGYQIQVGKYHLQHPENRLTLEDISLTSEFSPAEFTQRLNFQKDWFDVSADDIAFSELDFKRAFSKQEYKAGKVSVEGLDALIYRDKSVPLNTSAVKDLPQDMLRNINHWVHIDTLQVRGDITHQINPVNTEEIAKLDFNALDASLFHITSVQSLTDKPMRLVSNGKLAGIANFKAQATFSAQDPENQFTFSGQIDEMPLSALNQLLRPLANINIKDGHAEEIRFNMNGNNEIATGEMTFRYNDLKIQILNPETNDMQGLNQEIKTFFANTFVIRQNNPTFIVLKQGTIFQRRDPSRVIFHYWGEALLSGAVSSIGINKSKKDERKYDKEMEEENR